MGKQMNAQIDRPIGTLASHVNSRAELKLGTAMSPACISLTVIPGGQTEGLCCGAASTTRCLLFLLLLRSGEGHTLSLLWYVWDFSVLVFPVHFYCACVPMVPIYFDVINKFLGGDLSTLEMSYQYAPCAGPR